MNNSMIKIALIGPGIATAAVVFAPLATADTYAFLSPTRNISCEMEDIVYCQTFTPPQSVHLSADGTLTPCTGEGCEGNPGIGTPTLGYGQSANHGPFTCVSQTDGVTCTTASGRGFTISNSGIQTR
ncbi:MAG: hypothetical protein WAN71_22795 [Mycobacterium sp.]|uniref:hypothetical protein n=1 Tax=Mycobacterium sp. TaxID=1785 RepID=UPI003BAF42B0